MDFGMKNETECEDVAEKPRRKVSNFLNLQYKVCVYIENNMWMSG
jgi:hypothetical protein